MSAFSDLIPAPAARLWGYISGAAFEGYTSQEMFANLRAYAADKEIDISGIGAIPFSRMWGWANEIVQAERSFSASRALADILEGPYGLDLNAIALAPWGRGLLTVDQAGMERYEYKVEAVFNTPEYMAGDLGAPETETRWITVEASGRPLTTADVERDIMGVQPDPNGSPPSSVIGFGRVQIFQV